jgi:hypothetical protein
MERTRKATEEKEPVKLEVIEIREEKIRYKKVGGGALKLKNHFIKPNEIFMAYPSEIPKSFKDVIIPLDEIKTVPAPPLKVTPLQYKIQPSKKGEDLFDVVGPNGKILNEKALSKAVATKLLNDLSR